MSFPFIKKRIVNIKYSLSFPQHENLVEKREEAEKEESIWLKMSYLSRENTNCLLLELKSSVIDTSGNPLV